MHHLVLSFLSSLPLTTVLSRLASLVSPIHLPNCRHSLQTSAWSRSKQRNSHSRNSACDASTSHSNVDCLLPTQTQPSKPQRNRSFLLACRPRYFCNSLSPCHSLTSKSPTLHTVFRLFFTSWIRSCEGVRCLLFHLRRPTTFLPLPLNSIRHILCTAIIRFRPAWSHLHLSDVAV